jgi:hypothetical protein
MKDWHTRAPPTEPGVAVVVVDQILVRLFLPNGCTFLPRVMTIHYCGTLLVVSCVMASNGRAVMTVS